MNPQQPVALPPGWIAQWDPATNRYFFVDTRTNISTWDDPRGSSAANPSAPVSGNQTYIKPAGHSYINPNSVNQYQASSSIYPSTPYANQPPVSGPPTSVVYQTAPPSQQYYQPVPSPMYAPSAPPQAPYTPNSYNGYPPQNYPPQNYPPQPPSYNNYSAPPPVPPPANYGHAPYPGHASSSSYKPYSLSNSSSMMTGGAGLLAGLGAGALGMAALSHAAKPFHRPFRRKFKGFKGYKGFKGFKSGFKFKRKWK